MTSAQENLQNLQKIGKLKAEPPDQAEFDGLLRSAKRKLPDAQNETLSADSRFILAYDAAHSLALAWLPLGTSLYCFSGSYPYSFLPHGEVALPGSLPPKAQCCPV